MKLIDKDALVAEIERRIDQCHFAILQIPLTGRQRADATLECEILGKIIRLINSIEVKEVDLEKNCLTWEDIRDILDLYDEVTSMDYCSDIYGEVLKRFKAQKGE